MRRPLSHLATLALIPYAWLTWSLWFVCDDAYISFRFAKNAAQGHGLRYNLGDHVPVEGYSNFLWTVIASGVERVGLDPSVSMPALSAATVAVSMAGDTVVLVLVAIATSSVASCAHLAVGRTT